LINICYISYPGCSRAAKRYTIASVICQYLIFYILTFFKFWWSEARKLHNHLYITHEENLLTRWIYERRNRLIYGLTEETIYAWTCEWVDEQMAEWRRGFEKKDRRWAKLTWRYRRPTRHKEELETNDPRTYAVRNQVRRITSTTCTNWQNLWPTCKCCCGKEMLLFQPIKQLVQSIHTTTLLVTEHEYGWNMIVQL